MDLWVRKILFIVRAVQVVKELLKHLQLNY